MPSNLGALSRGSRSISNDIRGVTTETLDEILRLSIEMNDPAHIPAPDLLSNDWHPRPTTGVTTLSLVCKRWRTTVLNAPSMWTNILVYIDAPSSRSTSRIRLHIARSGNLPLSVLIVRKNTPTYLESQERGSVNTILLAFIGSFHRISSLFIESYYGSSLSDAAHLIFGQAQPLEKLELLTLNSVIDDSSFFGGSPTTRLNNPDGSLNLNTSPLRTLVIDGQSVLRLVADVPDLQVHLQHLVTLAVHGLTFRAGAFSQRTLESFFNVISALPRLSTLAFDEFDVEYAIPSGQGTPAIPAIHPVLSTFARRLVMKNMGTRSVDFVFSCITDPYEINLVGCPIRRLVGIPGSCICFKIVDMPWVSRLPMARMLVMWGGRNLEIWRSPVLVDVFLFTMATLLTAEHHFANLRSIKIDKCRIQSVTDFLERRADFLD